MNFDYTDQQLEMKRMIRDFAKKELESKAFEEYESLDEARALAKKLARQGLLGLLIQEEFGGPGLNLLDAVIAIEEMARYCPKSSGMMHVSCTGPVNFIRLYGQEEHLQRYLPKVLAGELDIAIAMTEPEAGSAVTALKTKAEPMGNGTYRVNGTKTMVSHADLADIFVVYARFGSSGSPKEIGAFIVEKGTRGLSLGQEYINMGGERQYEVVFEDMEIPEKDVLIKENAFGKLMGVYNGERMGAVARVMGLAQGAFDRAVAYSKERRQFNREICDFQGIQWMLADMAIKLDSSRLLLYRTASHAAESKLPPKIESSIAKIAVSEMAKEVCDMALQIHGGYGYMQEFPLEKLYREVRGSSIYGGTVQIHRNMIAEEILGRKLSQWKR